MKCPVHHTRNRPTHSCSHLSPFHWPPQWVQLTFVTSEHHLASFWWQTSRSYENTLYVPDMCWYLGRKTFRGYSIATSYSRTALLNVGMKLFLRKPVHSISWCINHCTSYSLWGLGQSKSLLQSKKFSRCISDGQNFTKLTLCITKNCIYNHTELSLQSRNTKIQN